MAEKISPDVPMTTADHRLVYALTAVVCRVHEQGGARATLFADELMRAWRQCESRNAHVLRLHDAAGALIKSTTPADLGWARSRASQALAEFAEWRLALAIEQQRAREVAA